MTLKNKEGLENLVVWQKSMDFVEYMYCEFLPQLPESEKY